METAGSPAWKALGLAPLVLWAVWGGVLGATSVGQADLLWAFSVASLAGAGGGAAALLYRCPRSTGSKVGYLVLLAVVWRLGYFPILVFSGIATSGVEWLVPGEGLGMGAIYATFLSFVWAFHLAVAGFLHLATRPAPPQPPTGLRRLLDRRVLLAITIPHIGVALAVSVIDPSEDLTLLPDWPHETAALKVPQVHAPQRNPYLPRLTEAGASIPERILAFNAGVTYEIIPPSRWGTAVKGTLEHLTFRNPDGSSADRVLEHHLAYLAADRWVRASSQTERQAE